MADRSNAPRRRVLMVSEHPYPDHPTLRRNVDYLLEQGVAVDLLCTTASPTALEAGDRPNLRLAAMQLQHRRSGPLRYIAEYGGFFAWALPRVCLLAMRRRYDAVQVDNVPDFLLVLAWPARLRGARVVFFMYELMPELTAARMRLRSSHLLIRILRTVERLATRWADQVVTVNEACRRLLAERAIGAERVVIVPNTQPRRSWPAPEPASPPHLVTHTTLVERYGVHVAIRALSLLLEEWPDLSLEVMGDGDQAATLRALAAELGLADQVAFLGFRPWSEAMARIRRARVGLVTVIADGYGELLLPNKLLDYVSQRVPVACSRLPAIAEYFPADTLGYFEPGDAPGLARQIGRLLRDPEQAAAQARRAEEALGRISWEEASSRYLDALGVR